MSNKIVLYTEIWRCPKSKHQQSAEYITERGKEEAFSTLGNISKSGQCEIERNARSPGYPSYDELRKYPKNNDQIRPVILKGRLY